MHAEDLELPHQFVLRDNDAKYAATFPAVFKASDTEVKRKTLVSPNLRARVHCFIRILQGDGLDKFVVVNEKYLNLINREFPSCYHYEWPHSAPDHLPPGCERRQRNGRRLS